MSPVWVPPNAVQSAWHHRFPDHHHLWAGRLRLWKVELAVAPRDSLLAEWVERAGGDASSRLGLPAAVVAAIRSGAGAVRKSFAFLELPGGLYAIPPPMDHFDEWPEPITGVPAEVLKPSGTVVLPFAGHWRTVPLVRAEIVRVMAGGSGNKIDLYLADEGGTLSELPLATVPADAIPAAEQGERELA